MLEADPAARASLNEVLAYRWMNPTPGPRSLGAYKAAKATNYAGLRWPEKVDHDLFRAPNDDAWRNKNLADVLELVARLCEAPNTRRPTRLSDLTLTLTPVVPKLRSRAALHWTSLFCALKGRRQNKPR